MKKFLAFLLAAMMIAALAACGTTTPPATQAPAAEPTATPEALSVEEAWKLEPAYGQTIRYWVQDACQSGPRVADLMGYFEEAGITVEGVRGDSYKEALGTAAVEVAVGHIATMLVPSTNGIDLSFVGGAHIGCKSLYALADGGYTTTEAMKGQKVAVPNGIGNSDYNITARLFDADGINPLTDVDLVQVENSACVAAMQNGEIVGALLGDAYAYNMVKDGTLVRVRSLLDDDFAQEPCCVIAMNTTFMKENPITARKVLDCVQKGHEYMREHPEECVNMLIEDGIMSGDFEKNFAVHDSLKFGLTEEFTEAGLRRIADDYIRLGFITSMSTVDEVMDKAWTPIPALGE